MVLKGTRLVCAGLDCDSDGRIGIGWSVCTDEYPSNLN
jgi:hypothetical protein